MLLEHPRCRPGDGVLRPRTSCWAKTSVPQSCSLRTDVWSESELQAFAGQRLADFKVPRVVAFVDEVPKGPTGKVQRIGLAARLGVTSRTERDRPDYAPPRSPLERALAGMIGDVLDVERVGVADDFFALGGDSLLAAELVARIRTAFDRPHFPLSTLVWAPTIEKLAVELDRPSVESARPLIVPLQADGDRTPLFFVHAMDGEIVRYAGLARRLDRDRPFLAVRARGADGDEAAHASLDAMVADYVDSVRQLQPQGPYILGGVCMGGAVAVEMAKRLQRAGEEVSLVILVDPRVQAPRSLAWLRVQAALTARKVGTGDYSWKLARAERRREVMSAVRGALGRPAPGTDPSRRAFEASMASIRRRVRSLALRWPRRALRHQGLRPARVVLGSPAGGFGRDRRAAAPAREHLALPGRR